MSLNFDLSSRKKVSHNEKIVKMCQFSSDSSRFFATNCSLFGGVSAKISKF
jgi:hypothetical protein